MSSNVYNIHVRRYVCLLASTQNYYKTIFLNAFQVSMFSINNIYQHNIQNNFTIFKTKFLFFSLEDNVSVCVIIFLN